MGLTPTANWMRAANSGSAEPILKFEFSPTIAYDECSGRTDWQSGENVIDIDTEHLSDELRLARNRSVYHPEQQLRQNKSFFPMMDIHIWENGVQVHDGATLGRLVQIFRSERSFKLKELRLSVHHNTQFTGRLIVRIVSGLSESISDSSAAGGASHVDQVLENTQELGRLEVNYGGNDPIVRDDDAFATWVVYDFSDQNVWIPGGDIPCAIVLEPAGSYKPTYLEFRGSPSSSSYAKGRLYWGIPSSKQYWLQSGQLSFKFTVDAFARSGSGEWLLDLGQAPPEGTEGELELRYCEPEGTWVVFGLAEADSAGSFGSYTNYSIVSDGSRISRRYVKIRLSMYSDSLGIDTPRIRSIRITFKRRINWLLASRPLFGCPNIVAEAPDYSAEGDPLSGSGAATDTSRIVLLDAGGIVSDLFASNYMKNDRVRVWLGFDTPYFRDSHGKDPGDWLPFKTVWIEDWQPGDSSMTVHCYDQQIRFRQAQAPAPADPPSQTEHICFDRANPVAIKYDLLRRAGIRPVEIDFSPAVGTLAAVSGDTGSFARLAAAHDWEMNYAISSATGLESVDSELNRHLLAFQLVDERGRWVVRYADFGCVYDPDEGWLRSGTALPTVESDHVAAGSETYSPGMKYLRNWGLVYFGGEGGDESAYSRLTISAGSWSAKANKENSSDKLLSAFIPADREDEAREVALHRRLLQQQGLRTVQFTTGLKYAGIQIGEHINFDSKYYRRPGAVSPNPLLVMVTRKNIDSNLSSINWAGVVLLDAEQVAEEEQYVEAPASLTVTAQGDGTALWEWPASSNETAGGVVRYELFQRLSNLNDWGAAIATVQATGEESYEWRGSAYQEALQYDFGVRAVHSSGVFSAVTVCENVVLTGPVPSAPGTSDWELRTAPGTITVAVLNPVDGATSYNVYVFTTTGWQRAGSFPPGEVFGYDVPDPFSRKVYLLSITAVNEWGESGKAGLKVKLNEPLNPGDFVPGTPEFASDGGTYPLVTWLPVGPYQAFSITLKLIPPAQYADFVERYEIERRDKLAQEGEQWTDWERLPDHQLKLHDNQLPSSPKALFYDNTDRRLKPGRTYQYRARAVSRWGVAGAWSGMTALLLTDDTTGPDQPVIAVYDETGRVRIEISEPAIAGEPCPDFSHFVIEGNHDGQGWQVLDPHWTSTTFYHTGADNDLEVDWSYRVSAVDFSGNVSPVSTASPTAQMGKAGTTFLADAVLGTGTPGTLSQITQNAQDIDLRVQYEEVINSINVSTEGIRINASRLSVSGSTEFASGYDPYSKLESTGGRYDSSSSGARVRIFPDDNTGIQVTDGTNDVFKCVVGGTDVGDVIIGSISGQHVMWDKSAGALEISGVLDASGGIKTGTGNDRIELGKYGGTDQIKFYTGGSESGWIKSDSGELTLKMLSGSDYHYLTRHGFGIYKSGKYYARLQTGSYSELILEDDYSQSIQLSTVPFESTDPSLAFNNTQVLTVQQAPISNPSETVSSNNEAIISILDALRTHGIIDT